MARIPMTAKEQLVRARELGHEVSLETRTNPDYPNEPPKFVIHCTCGYQSTARRSRKAASGTIIWHMGKAISEFDDLVNGR